MVKQVKRLSYYCPFGMSIRSTRYHQPRIQVRFLMPHLVKGINMHILFLNGPPRSGKDTIADYLVMKGYKKMKFAEVIFYDLQNILGLTDEQLSLYREEKKDDHLLFDTTLRKMAINYSEKVIIPRHGEHYWSKILLEKMRNYDYKSAGKLGNNIVVSDLGFEREYEFFEKNLRFPYEQFTVIRVERKGCSYANDSREYVKSYDHVIKNNGSLELLYEEIEKLQKLYKGN